MQQIILTTEENTEIKHKIARLEGLAAGYQAGIEEAKRLLIRELLERRNDAISQQGNAASGQNAIRPNEHNAPLQSAGGNEPERTDGINRALFPIRLTDPRIERAFRGDDGSADEPFPVAPTG